jgi:tRNA pseudouridine55 synthase
MMKKTENKLPNVLVSFKEVGETPLEVVTKLKKHIPEFGGAPITYAGRLDPMAEGLLLLLIGDEVHNKDEYLKLEKEYYFEVIFGFATDTYDVLGRIEDTEDGVISENTIEAAIKGLVGTYNQKYPPYSSKPVEGKPLFKWAREGRLLEIEIPSHQVTIDKLDFEGMYSITANELKDTLSSNIDLVKGDFRQDEIKELWDAYVDNSMLEEFQIAKFRTTCSSGTYVRAIVNDLGKKLRVPLTTFHIKRERVGGYRIDDVE